MCGVLVIANFIVHMGNNQILATIIVYKSELVLSTEIMNTFDVDNIIIHICVLVRKINKNMFMLLQKKNNWIGLGVGTCIKTFVLCTYTRQNL